MMTCYLLPATYNLWRKGVFKFVTLYYRVDDEPMLEEFFSRTHLPLTESLPGLIKREVSRITGKPGGGSRFHLMVEAYFADQDVFFQALTSESGQNLMTALKPWADERLLAWFYADSFSENK
jgi:uncharacterized protein (TIGR02118 family)